MRKERVRKVYIKNPKVSETYTIRDLTFTILSEFYKNCKTYTICFYKIQFKDTLTVKEYSREALRVGKIEDYNRPTIYKKGIVGEDMQTKFYPVHNKTFYSHWHLMIIRCFSEDKNINRGASCCTEWLNLKNFYDWWIQQDYKEGYELDKDLIALANHEEGKIYSPNTCLLIPKEVNRFFKGYSDMSNIYEYNNKWYVDTNYNGERFTSWCLTYEEALLAKKNKKREWFNDLASKLNLNENLKDICLKILE